MSNGDGPSNDLFRKFEIFDGLTSEDLDAISTCTRLESVVAGEAILEEGGRSRDLFGLLEGRVEVIKQNGDGEQTLTELEPYKAFGELGLAVGAPRTATVRTLADSRFLHVDGERFHRLQTSRHDAAYKVEHNILRILARRLRDVNREMMQSDGD